MMFASVPFTEAANFEDDNYRVVQRVTESEYAPVVTDSAYAVGNQVYESRGFVRFILPENETVYSLGDGTHTIVTIDNDKNEYHIYRSGNIIAHMKYSMEDTYIFPFDKNGEFAVIMHLDDNGEPYEYQFLDENAELSDSSVGVGYVYAESLGERVIAYYDAEGKVHVEFYEFAYDPYRYELLTDIDVDEIGDFTNGVAYYVTDGRYGLVNNKGKVILYPEYEYMTFIGNGYVIAVEDYDETAGVYSNATVFTEDGEKEYQSEEDIVYYDNNIVVLYDGSRYTLMSTVTSKVLADGDTYHYEEGYHLLSESDTSTGVLYNSKGKEVVSDVIEFSVDTLTGEAVVLSDADGKYHRYSMDGKKLETYSTDMNMHCILKLSSQEMITEKTYR